VFVKDANGNINPDNFNNPQHTSYKVDGEEMCIGEHFWRWALERGGSVAFCVDEEVDPVTRVVLYRSRHTYSFFATHIANRLGYGEHVSPTLFAAGLRVAEPPIYRR
jgi:hypothetical protein